MSIKITRREFIAGSVAVASFATAALVWKQAASAPSPLLIRLTSGSYGGTSCYRFASIAQRLAGVEKNHLRRDWSQKCNSFQILTSRSLEAVVKDIWSIDETVNLEVSHSPLVSAEHMSKLSFHNYKRISSGFSRITLEEFATLYPTVGSHRWISIDAPQLFRKGRCGLSANRNS